MVYTILKLAFDSLGTNTTSERLGVWFCTKRQDVVEMPYPVTISLSYTIFDLPKVNCQPGTGPPQQRLKSGSKHGDCLSEYPFDLSNPVINQALELFVNFLDI